MIQAYNNWYDSLPGGSIDYLKDVYLNWRNILSPYCTGCSTIANFTGVSASKLALGVPASASASPAYAYLPSTIDDFQSWLTAQNYTVAGFMIWDSHWDALNQYQISNAILTNSQSTPLTPKNSSTTMLCT